MKKNTYVKVKLLAYLAGLTGCGLFLFFFLTSCTFDTSGIAVAPKTGDPPQPTIKDLTIKGELRIHTEKKLKPPAVVPPYSLEDNPNYPQIKNQYQIVDNFIAGNNLLYYDKNVSATETNYGEIKGSYFVQPSIFDWKINDQNFLGIKIQDEVANIYVAYESRIVAPPSWLTQDYERLVDPQNPGEPYTVTLSTGTKMQLYRLKQKNLPSIGQTFWVPGNAFGNPQWEQTASGIVTPKMYIVIIEPPKVLDMSKYESKPFTYRRCYENPAAGFDYKQEAKNEACQQAGAKPPEIECVINSVEENPNPPAACAYSVGQLSFPIKSRLYSRSSEIAFNKLLSQVNLKIAINGGKSYLKNITGHLDFQYELDEFDSMKIMWINSMEIKVDPIDTEVGKIENIIISLVNACNATCQDSPPPVLCKNYQVPAGEFLCSEYCTVDGKPLLFATINKQPVDIDVDIIKKTFAIKTPSLQSSIKINGKDTPVEIAVDFAGKFVNFAPTVFVQQESKPWAECVDYINKTPISLYAEVIDPDGQPPPGNITWYEDYGQVTQKVWGTGYKLSIPPAKLHYGVHDFTVIAEDTKGVRDATSIEVAVRDSTPPHLTIPADIIFLRFQQRSPVKINLGKAWAGDNCLSGVEINNDAPEKNLFPDGVTKVTWIADDLRGNSATKVQQVIVIHPEGKFMPKLMGITAHLRDAVVKSRESVKECQSLPECRTSLQPLIRVVGQLRELAIERSGQEGQAELGREIARKLTAGQASLQQVETLINRSNRIERQRRPELRSAAAERLGQAGVSLTQVLELSGRIKNR